MLLLSEGLTLLYYPVFWLVQNVELMTHFHGTSSMVSIQGKPGRQVTGATAAPLEVWESFSHSGYIALKQISPIAIINTFILREFFK